LISSVSNVANLSLRFPSSDWLCSRRDLFFNEAQTVKCLLGWLFCFGVCFGAEAAGTNALLFSERFERSLAGRWEQLKFGRPTDYSIVREGSSNCLKAVADQTCSALMTKVELKPPARLVVRWQWKIDHVPTNSTDNIASSFDHTARIIIAFDTFFGPPRTLNYVWANRENIGAEFPHPLSGRAQMIALQSGNQKAGAWIAEKRDVTADWHLLFGDKPMPAIVAVGVITDSENTGTQVTGCYQNIELLAE
jgi:hypothetical protein